MMFQRSVSFALLTLLAVPALAQTGAAHPAKKAVPAKKAAGSKAVAAKGKVGARKAVTKPGAKTAVKPGSKPNAKLGAKSGAKSGLKAGLKPGTKAAAVSAAGAAAVVASRTGSAAESETSPVGRWSAFHTPDQPLALWWDFRPDGTLTLTAGAIVRTHYKLEGSMLTLASSSLGVPPGVFDVQFAGGKLYSTSRGENAPTIVFSPEALTLDPAHPLVGRWHVTSAPPAPDATGQAIRERMLHMVVVYGADGSYQSRTPVQLFEGTWSAATHTYKLKDYPPLAFSRQGKSLTLALPPDGKDKHTYNVDTFFP